MIYKSVFQKEEFNYGFRFFQGVLICIIKLYFESQRMIIAVEGDIEEVYNFVKCKILI